MFVGVQTSVLWWEISTFVCASLQSNHWTRLWDIPFATGLLSSWQELNLVGKIHFLCSCSASIHGISTFFQLFSCWRRWSFDGASQESYFRFLRQDSSPRHSWDGSGFSLWFVLRHCWCHNEPSESKRRHFCSSTPGLEENLWRHSRKTCLCHQNLC